MKASVIYNSGFLLEDLYRAAIRRDRSAFVEFQLNALNQNECRLNAEFLTVNILRLNEKCLLDGELTSAVANLDESVVDSYQKALFHDDFTPNTLFNPGVAVFNTAYRHMDDWIDHPIYTNHCNAFAHHWVLGVSYRYPNQKPSFVAFDYIREKGNPFADDLTEEYAEYLSYPFYLGWLHIFGAICEDYLKDWLTLCAGISPARFRILRALAGQGIGKSSILATALHVKPGTIESHLNLAYENLLCIRPELENFSGNADRRLLLARAYRFFEYGSGNIDRPLPRRRFHLPPSDMIIR
jgi:hypothetical protein